MAVCEHVAGDVAPPPEGEDAGDPRPRPELHHAPPPQQVGAGVQPGGQVLTRSPGGQAWAAAVSTVSSPSQPACCSVTDD